jgi:peptidoglycan/xylan/chitin deacetylase (PgdA/CDA1 family)
MGMVQDLNARGVKVTFFVLGGQLHKYADILKFAYDSGHQIGIHTWSHTRLIGIANEQIVGEVMWTANAIYDVIGVSPLYFRPPCI